MKKLILVLALLLCLTIIPGAMGETLTGSLGSTTWNSTNLDRGFSGSLTNYHYNGLEFNHIDLSEGYASIVNWPGVKNDYDTGAPDSASASCNVREYNIYNASDETGQILGTCTIGYQRFWNTQNPPVEQPGFTWIIFNNDLNFQMFSGDTNVVIEYDHSKLYNITLNGGGAGIGYPDPNGVYAAFQQFTIGNIGGQYTLNKKASIDVSYTATKPSGLGIAGSINKNTNARIFIANANHTTLTSESYASRRTFNFTVPDDQIYICAQGIDVVWYNSSLLFGVGVVTPTYTSTPTPTITPPPTGEFNIQFYVKDNGNSTAINNAYVELHAHNTVDSIYAGYTDSGGLITFAGQSRPTYAPGYSQMEARFWKTGYQYASWSFDPTQTGDLFHTEYLIPDNGANPQVPSTVNITVHAIDASNGNADLANAYVEVYPNVPGSNGVIDWTYKLTGTTNAYGLYIFQNVPASAYNEIKTTKSGYSTDDYWIGVTPLSDFSHTAYLTTFGVTPTPTSLPTSGNYKLVISPVSVPNGGNTTGTISSTADPSLAGIQQVWYAYGNTISKGVDAFDFFESGSYSKALQYIKTGGNWMGWDYATSSFSNNKGATIPNPADLIFNGPGGTKTVYCTITLTNGTQYDLLGTVVVGAGAAQITTHIQARDGTGQGLIYGPEIDILNKNTGIWKNATYPTGAADITSPSGTYFDVYGIKAGYSNAQLLNIKARDDITYELPFFSGVTPSAGTQSFNLWVTNVNGLAIPGASVKITESGTTTYFTGTTGENGIIQFILKTTTLYNYNVIRAGYQSASGSFTTTADPSGVWVVQLIVGVNPTATTPPVGTPTPTIIPTNTAGNYTGFWGPLAEGAKGAGASSVEVPLLLAALLIFIGFCVGGWSGAAYSPGSSFNGQASMAGGVFGFVLACMFGFIPIVWVISIIVIGIFVFIFFVR